MRRTSWREASAAPGNRLRINAQLVDTRTDFPLWSERYDREMKDVFEVQDEIARKIAEALRITLSPQEQEALAAKPTENLQAYDLYLRGKSYARRLTRQDLEFALQNVRERGSAGPEFRAGLRRHRQRLRAEALQLRTGAAVWMERAMAASQTGPVALRPELPEALVAQAWNLYANGRYEEAVLACRRPSSGQERLRGRVLQLRAHVVRRGPLPGDRRYSGKAIGSQRPGL